MARTVVAKILRYRTRGCALGLYRIHNSNRGFLNRNAYLPETNRTYNSFAMSTQIHRLPVIAKTLEIDTSRLLHDDEKAPLATHPS